MSKKVKPHKVDTAAYKFASEHFDKNTDHEGWVKLVWAFRAGYYRGTQLKYGKYDEHIPKHFAPTKPN